MKVLEIDADSKLLVEVLQYRTGVLYKESNHPAQVVPVEQSVKIEGEPTEGLIKFLGYWKYAQALGYDEMHIYFPPRNRETVFISGH